MLTDALARDQNNALVTDAFRPQSGDSFAHISWITMAECMQIEYDLCLLFRDNKAVEIGAVKKNCEMKVITAISQAKIWDTFQSGKHVRDLYAELLVPKHVTKAWQRGVELRALKCL